MALSIEVRDVFKKRNALNSDLRFIGSTKTKCGITFSRLIGRPTGISSAAQRSPISCAAAGIGYPLFPQFFLLQEETDNLIFANNPGKVLGVKAFCCACSRQQQRRQKCFGQSSLSF
jgi:hypothetical protein